MALCRKYHDKVDLSELQKIVNSIAYTDYLSNNSFHSWNLPINNRSEYGWRTQSAHECKIPGSDVIKVLKSIKAAFQPQKFNRQYLGLCGKYSLGSSEALQNIRKNSVHHILFYSIDKHLRSSENL